MLRLIVISAICLLTFPAMAHADPLTLAISSLAQTLFTAAGFVKLAIVVPISHGFTTLRRKTNVTVERADTQF